MRSLSGEAGASVDRRCAGLDEGGWYDGSRRAGGRLRREFFAPAGTYVALGAGHVLAGRPLDVPGPRTVALKPDGNMRRRSSVLVFVPV